MGQFIRVPTDSSRASGHSGGSVGGFQTAAMGSDSNKTARRASKMNLAHIDCLCFMDLWDHRGGVGALVGRFWT